MTEEAIIGEIPVSTQLALGVENLRLFLTPSRFIVARAGKRGAGAAAGISLLGKFTAGLEGLFRGGKGSLKRQGPGELTPERVLGAHKDNFFIAYEEIIRVELGLSSSKVKITVLTTDDKFQFQTSSRMDPIRTLLTNALGSKVTSPRPSA